MKTGDRVRVERDEARYPPRGTWPEFRGKLGTVVEVNRAGSRRTPEYGVTFNGRPRADAWFLRHELVPAGCRKQTGADREGEQSRSHLAHGP